MALSTDFAQEDLDALDADQKLRQQYDAVVSARTGIDCMDSWVTELIETGYLHNHARMWFASIWIFTLGLPWALGADFFYRHLLDGDPASNTLGYQDCQLGSRSSTRSLRLFPSLMLGLQTRLSTARY